ncbi:MAG: 5-formyltetrahydrofolate cyclo-ligase [Pseudomonadota bacterium]
MSDSQASSSAAVDQPNKRQQRRRYRELRRALTPQAQLQASLGLARNARSYRQLFNLERVLAYAPIAGEIDPGVLLTNLKAQVYLPRIVNYRTGSMQFFRAAGIQRRNQLGIMEPDNTREMLPARHLDAVLLPLVAFSRDGNRLGMGGGFYDRAFEFRLRFSSSTRPLLIGVAHHFQQAERLAHDPWDVPLDAIITDRELIRF